MSANMDMMQRKNDDIEQVQARPAVAPLVDIYENEEQILVLADLPGVSEDALTVRLEKDQLFIEGRVGDMVEGDATVLAADWRPVDFRRTFLVPRGIDAEKISATLAGGVLTLKLPKSAAIKPRQITVRAG